MIKRLLQITGITNSPEEHQAEVYRELMKAEGRIGGEVFGPIPHGGRRSFFCLDEHTWIWHEEWKDESGKKKAMTTRYDVRPEGIVKAQDGKNYQLVSPREAKRLCEAVALYQRRVTNELYQAVL